MFNFSWILDERLAGGSRPGWLGDLRGDLGYIHQQGVRAIVGFVEPGVTMDYAAVPGIEFECLVLEVEDHTAPSRAIIDQGLVFIDTCVGRDLPVMVHCLAGIGRTGTLLACYLAREQRLDGGTAIRRLRALRPNSVETPDQEAMVRSFAASLRA